MDKMIIEKARAMYPIERFASEYTAFIQGAKFAIALLWRTKKSDKNEWLV